MHLFEIILLDRWRSSPSGMREPLMYQRHIKEAYSLRELRHVKMMILGIKCRLFLVRLFVQTKYSIFFLKSNVRKPLH